MSQTSKGSHEAIQRQAEVLGDGPRIPPLSADQASEEQKALISRMRPPQQARKMKGANETEWAEILAHHPALFAAHMGFAQQFMANPALSPRDRELAVLRLGWITGSPFEWGNHVVIGKGCGLSEEEIDRVTHGADADGWSVHEQAILRATDELHSDSMISDGTWADLAAGLDERQLIELTMLVGNYLTVAFYQNSLRFRLPAGNEGLAAR